MTRQLAERIPALDCFASLAMTAGTTIVIARSNATKQSSENEWSQFGQMYPVPDGDLKQPTDSGITCLGSQSTTFGK
jgi:hypothetical protein